MPLSSRSPAQGVDAQGIYLDYNSTAPTRPEVWAAMQAADSAGWGNPSSVHRRGRTARDLLESARETIGEYCGFHPRDLIFTSGGTEANNLALAGTGPLILSRLEHPSVVAVAEAATAQGRFVSWLPVQPSGEVRLADIDAALRSTPSGATVVLMAANHETGVVQDVAGAGRLAMRQGARLHVDAVQWLGKQSMEDLACADSVAVTAHKVGGPKGIGALLFRGPTPSGVLRGGAQERGLRPGTQGAAHAVGFARAVALIDLAKHAALSVLRDRLDLSLADYSEVNGASRRLAHVTNRSFPGWQGAELVAALDLQGVQCSSGSACSAGTTEPSPVIEAMNDRRRAACAVRFSLGWATTEAELQRAIAIVHEVLGTASGRSA